MKKTVLPVILATVWISISEFVRNEYVFKSYWVEHYAELGLVFPSEPINGIIWGVWSLIFAISLFIILKKFCPLQATFLGWTVGFVLMWLVVGNMNVLPFKLLYWAVPWSIIEVFVAVLIINSLIRKWPEKKE